MIIRFFVVLLGLCGLGLILCGLLETLFFSTPSDVYHVIPLGENGADAESRVRKSLYSLKGKLYFVDLGLDADSQLNVELLLRGRSHAMLVAPSQLPQELRWEMDLGAGTDQGNDHVGDFPK